VREQTTLRMVRSTRKTVAFRLIDHWLLTVYGISDPTDAEWAVCADKFRSMDLRHLRVLIYTEGGAPSAAQRKVMNDVVNGRTFPTALVSSSAMMRGIATAMSWFNKGIKAFEPDAIEDALAYMEVPQDRVSFFLSEIENLLSEIRR